MEHPQFLGAFAKLRKATIGFVKSVSVLPSVRMKQLCSQRKVFQLNLIREYFPKKKKYPQNSRFIKI